MLAQSQEIRCLADLRDFVNLTLCDLHNLQIDAFRMTERILRRGGRPCGIHFCLHGPRSVKFTAIWETDRNQILFYSANGERSLKTQLSEPLCMEHRAA
jgi:hypothetical protein